MPSSKYSHSIAVRWNGEARLRVDPQRKNLPVAACEIAIKPVRSGKLYGRLDRSRWRFRFGRVRRENRDGGRRITCLAIIMRRTALRGKRIGALASGRCQTTSSLLSDTISPRSCRSFWKIKTWLYPTAFACTAFASSSLGGGTSPKCLPGGVSIFRTISSPKRFVPGGTANWPGATVRAKTASTVKKIRCGASPRNFGGSRDCFIPRLAWGWKIECSETARRCRLNCSAVRFGKRRFPRLLLPPDFWALRRALDRVTVKKS